MMSLARAVSAVRAPATYNSTSALRPLSDAERHAFEARRGGVVLNTTKDARAAHAALRAWRDTNDATQWAYGGSAAGITPDVRRRLLRECLHGADELVLYRVVGASASAPGAPVYVARDEQCEYFVCTAWVRSLRTARTDARRLLTREENTGALLLYTVIPADMLNERVVVDLTQVREPGEPLPMSVRGDAQREDVLLAPGALPYVGTTNSTETCLLHDRFRAAFPRLAPELFHNRDRA